MGKAPRGWEFVGNRRRKARLRIRPPSSPPGKKRLLIVKHTRQRITEMMLGWRGSKFTWPLLMKEINAEFGGNWKYQSVARFPDLQALFTATQIRVRKSRNGGVSPAKAKSANPTIVVLRDRVEYLQAENADLKRRLDACEARMSRWRKNAVLNRIPIAVLDEPMQENDRGRSDK
jgi:hypothetical protein